MSINKIIDILEENNPECLLIMVLDACRNDPTKGKLRGNVEGLAAIDPPLGTLIAYATAPGKYAADGSKENGLYTSELMKQMKIAQPIEDVFKYTRSKVEALSDGAQVPWEQSSLRGSFRLQ